MRQYAFEGPCQGVPYYYTRPRHEVLPFPRRSASFITESHLFVNEHFSDFRESFSRLQDISGTSGVKVSCIFQKKSALRVRFFFLNIWVGRSRWKFRDAPGFGPVLRSGGIAPASLPDPGLLRNGAAVHVFPLLRYDARGLARSVAQPVWKSFGSLCSAVYESIRLYFRGIQC